MIELPVEVLKILDQFNTEENRIILHRYNLTGANKLKQKLNNALAVLPDKWMVVYYTVRGYPNSQQFVHTFKRFLIRRELSDNRLKKENKYMYWDLLTGRQLFYTVITGMRWPIASLVVATDKKSYVPLGDPKYFVDPTPNIGRQRLEQSLLVCSDIAEELGEQRVAWVLKYLATGKEKIYRIKLPKK